MDDRGGKRVGVREVNRINKKKKIKLRVEKHEDVFFGYYNGHLGIEEFIDDAIR